MCERRRIRGLACHYAPERRPHRWGRGAEAVPDRGSGQSIPVLPLNEARPRSGDTHGPLSRIVDMECRGDVQLAKDTPRCLAAAPLVEVPATSLSSDTVPSDRSHRLLDVRAPSPRKSHVPLETVEPSIMCEGKDNGGRRTVWVPLTSRRMPYRCVSNSMAVTSFLSSRQFSRQCRPSGERSLHYANRAPRGCRRCIVSHRPDSGRVLVPFIILSSNRTVFG